MFIYIHKYMYKMYYMKVFGNPSDNNFGPILLNLFGEVTSLERSLLTFPTSNRLRQV